MLGGMLQENHAYQVALLSHNMVIMYYEQSQKSMLFIGFSLPSVERDERSDWPMNGNLTMLGVIENHSQLQLALDW